MRQEIDAIAAGKLEFWNHRKNLSINGAPCNRSQYMAYIQAHRKDIKSKLEQMMLDRGYRLLHTKKSSNIISYLKKDEIENIRLITTGKNQKNFLFSFNAQPTDKIICYDNEDNEYRTILWEDFATFLNNHGKAATFTTENPMWIIPKSIIPMLAPEKF